MLLIDSQMLLGHFPEKKTYHILWDYFYYINYYRIIEIIWQT